ncbi:hypothetical protein PV10_07173 [Exophiala mesophila]|uniref:Cytochrome c oxidase assembly factor 3 n=1 Tax=Exophiala mesophila TaxID=212818 RepID=A0A0D1ZSI8_EXOME|nr:uncharacterized protein PV10_07173 [Exophiala mesophila]KIV89798.1 hypothetical protein PV10_07173 [Exophiala mesophila]
MHSSPALRGLLKRSSYYDSDYRQSAALIRARRPFLFRNILTGTGIAMFAVGVFVFTLKAVGQDKFEDVVVPDAPQQSQSQSQS